MEDNGDKNALLEHDHKRKTNSEIQKFVTISEIFVSLRPETTAMRIISKKTLVKYYTAHPQSKLMLEDWYEKTKKADWKNFADIRATFNTVSSVGNQRYVFNIKGNDYRLVVIIKFHPSHVLIRFVGTHAEYDRIANIIYRYGTNKK